MTKYFCTDTLHSVCPTADGHAGCFYLLSTMNRAAIDIGI